MAVVVNILSNFDDKEIRRAQRELKKFGVDAESVGGKLGASMLVYGRRMQTLGDKMASAGKSMTTGFTLPVVAGFALAVKAAGEAQLAEAKLANTLKQMPALAGANINVFKKSAAAIGKMTAAEDDAVIAAYAMLGTFQVTEKQMTGMMPLIVDYARKFDTDLVNAATQVGKALDGQLGALKKNGVSIDENVYAMDRYRAVSEALQSQVGGFARSELATFPAQLEQLKNELGNLAEEVGTALIPMLQDGMAVVRQMADAFGQLSPEAKKSVIQVVGFGAAIGPVVWGLGTFLGAAGKLMQSLAPLASKLRNAADAAGGLKAGSVAGVAGAVGLGIALGDLAKDTEPVKKALSDVEQRYAGLKPDPTLKETLAAPITGLSYWIGKTMVKSQKFYDQQQASTYAVTGAERALSEQTILSRNATEAYRLSTDNLRRAKDNERMATEASKSAELAMLYARQQVKSATENLAAAIKQYGKNSTEARIAALELENANASLAEKTAEYKGAQDKANASTNQAKTAMDNAKAAADRLRSSYVLLKDAAGNITGIRSTTGGGTIPVYAQGGMLPAAQGGHVVRVAEGGDAEAIIPINNAPRSYALLAETMRRMGVSGRGGVTVAPGAVSVAVSVDGGRGDITGQVSAGVSRAFDALVRELGAI